MAKRYTIAVDFDGVLHSYTTPWVAAHVIPDKPVAGAIEWLWRMVHHFDVVVLSTRGKSWRGRRAMRAWLKEHAGLSAWYDSPAGPGLEDVRFTAKKIAALIYLDDRAVRFTGPGSFPTPDAIHAARPWNKPASASPAGEAAETKEEK